MRSYTPFFLLLAGLISAAGADAQVQVSEEPYHRPVIRNRYFRLLDVWLQPGDTTGYHVHSTPSVFLHFTSTGTGSQVKGGSWTHERSVAGKTWFRSFAGDTLVHRVCNNDTIPFHVTDAELLSAYRPGSPFTAMPFDVVLENEKVIVYRAGREAIHEALIKGRGPMLAELVEGSLVYEFAGKEKAKLAAGNILYIPPDEAILFAPSGTAGIQLLIIELK